MLSNLHNILPGHKSHRLLYNRKWEKGCYTGRSHLDSLSTHLSLENIQRSSNKKVICILEYFSDFFLSLALSLSLLLFSLPLATQKKRKKQQQQKKELKLKLRVTFGQIFLSIYDARNGNTAFSRSLHTHRSMKHEAL